MSWVLLGGRKSERPWSVLLGPTTSLRDPQLPCSMERGEQGPLLGLWHLCLPFLSSRRLRAGGVRTGGQSSHLLSSLQLPSSGFRGWQESSFRSLTAAQLLIVPFSEVGSLHFRIYLLSAPFACLLGRIMAELLVPTYNTRDLKIFWSKALKWLWGREEQTLSSFWVSSLTFASHSFCYYNH